MFSLNEKLGLLQFIRKEALPLLISLLIAELFFKFGSFTLECGLFLITWFLVGKASKEVKDAIGKI